MDGKQTFTAADRDTFKNSKSERITWPKTLFLPGTKGYSRSKPSVCSQIWEKRISWEPCRMRADEGFGEKLKWGKLLYNTFVFLSRQLGQKVSEGLAQGHKGNGQRKTLEVKQPGVKWQVSSF